MDLLVIQITLWDSLREDLERGVGDSPNGCQDGYPRLNNMQQGSTEFLNR